MTLPAPRVFLGIAVLISGANNLRNRHEAGSISPSKDRFYTRVLMFLFSYALVPGTGPFSRSLTEKRRSRDCARDTAHGVVRDH